MSAIHNAKRCSISKNVVVCDIGGYDFVSYSQPPNQGGNNGNVVCDIGGYDFVSYSQPLLVSATTGSGCL